MKFIAAWHFIHYTFLHYKFKKGPCKQDPFKYTSCSDSYRIQTYNLLIRSQMLYSVELRSHVK